MILSISAFSNYNLFFRRYPKYKKHGRIMVVEKFAIILLLLFGLALPGCHSDDTKYTIPSRLATSVDITCKRPSGTLHRHYSDPGKVEAVLHYVRLLKPKGPTVLPEDATKEDDYEIVIHLLDGGHRIHRQRGNSYAALHHRYWGQIQPSLGMRLGHLMALLPSDTVDTNYIDMP